MSINNRVIENLEKRRENIINGNINCIPSPFERFRDDFPGIEQGKYYLVSGATKAGKSQLTNFIFLYNSVLYAYDNPDKISLRILYYPLEETQESIILRFMSYLLYTKSGGKIRKSPLDLKSVREDNPVSQEVLDILKSEPYKSILDFFEEHVTFIQDKNPYGIYRQAQLYAEHNGTIHYKTLEIKDNKTGEVVEKKEVFDYYTPDNANEYVLIIVDHISLISAEKNLDLRESINKLSDYMIQLRNRYNYTPIIIQQQGAETTNLDAFKANKIRPTISGLSDSKYTAKDCSIMLGITNPFMHELPEYLGYDIKKLKGYARFLEIVINREGQANGIIGLYFDGACNFYHQLPLPDDKDEIQKVYNLIEENKRKQTNKLFLIFRKFKQLKLK